MIVMWIFLNRNFYCIRLGIACVLSFVLVYIYLSLRHHAGSWRVWTFIFWYIFTCWKHRGTILMTHKTMLFKSQKHVLATNANAFRWRTVLTRSSVCQFMDHALAAYGTCRLQSVQTTCVVLRITSDSQSFRPLACHPETFKMALI